MEDKKQFIREEQMIMKSELIMIRLSTLRHIERLSENENHFLGEIIFRLGQLNIAIKRISVELKNMDSLQLATLDIETVYWISFRIIKCLQRIKLFGRSWGGNLGISIMRNKVLEHFEPDKSGKYRNFSLSLKNTTLSEPSFNTGLA